MKPSTFKRLLTSSWFTGKPYGAWPQGVKSLPLSWGVDGYSLRMILSRICVPSTLVGDQGRKFNI